MRTLCKKKKRASWGLQDGKAFEGTQTEWRTLRHSAQAIPPPLSPQNALNNAFGNLSHDPCQLSLLLLPQVQFTSTKPDLIAIGKCNDNKKLRH